MAVAPNKKWTREEYLDFERANEGRHEFLDGEVFAMVGASLKHTFIAASTTQSFSTWRLSARRRRRRSTPPPLAFGRATPT